MKDRTKLRLKCCIGSVHMRATVNSHVTNTRSWVEITNGRMQMFQLPGTDMLLYATAMDDGTQVIDLEGPDGTDDEAGAVCLGAAAVLADGSVQYRRHKGGMKPMQFVQTIERALGV